MRGSMPSIAVAIAVGAAGCSGGGSGPPGPAGARTYAVDAVAGNDSTGDGTSSRPYRTITRGLQFATWGDTIQVAPGTYDAALGEAFPIYVRAGVTVSGDVAAKGAGTAPVQVSGAGAWMSLYVAPTVSSAFVTSTDARVEGLHVTAPGATGVWCEQAGVVVRSNTIVASDSGIVVAAGDTSVEILGNDLSGNGVGLATVAGAAARVRDNTVVGNGRGIAIGAGTAPDLGTALDRGGNRLAGNADCDLENASSAAIDAIGNEWDDNPFLFAATSACNGGANVANLGAGVVRFPNVPASDAPVFGGATAIAVTSPAPGAIVSTTQPSLVWVPPAASYTIAVIASDWILVRDRHVDNPEVIVWAWNSGLAHGVNGDVMYADGVPVVGGELQGGAPPALQRGRTYFWAVWSWDADGLVIDRASRLAYFTISN